MTTTVVNKRIHTSTPNDVYIGRPGPWGNPWIIGRDGDRKEVIQKFIDHFNQPEFKARTRRELKGKTLVCWCKPFPCHGDWLMEVAES